MARRFFDRITASYDSSRARPFVDSGTIGGGGGAIGADGYLRES